MNTSEKNLLYMKYTIDLPNLRIFTEKLKLQSFFEAISLKNFPGAISGITSRALNTRRTDPNANKDIQVIEADWSKAGDSLTIYFNVTPTYLQRMTTVLTPGASEYQGTFYNVVFQFLNVGQYLGDPAAFEVDPNKQKSALANVFLSCEVRLHSNDPSFYYQGMWEDLANVGSAIYSFPGPSGDGVWRQRHAAAGGLSNPRVRVTKHMMAIAQTITSHIPNILQKLRVTT